jgi:hypothetical protein
MTSLSTNSGQIFNLFYIPKIPGSFPDSSGLLEEPEVVLCSMTGEGEGAVERVGGTERVLSIDGAGEADGVRGGTGVGGAENEAFIGWASCVESVWSPGSTESGWERPRSGVR